MFLIKRNQKIKKKEILLFSFYILSIIFVRFYYSQTLNLIDIADISDIDQGNFLIKSIGIYFLDDSTKFEIFLREGIGLFFFHGGVGLEFLVIILKFFFSKKFLIFGVMLVNFLMIIDNYLLFRKNTSFIIWVLLIPFLTYSTISFNKEVATITTLLSFTFLNTNNLNINSFEILLSPRFYIRLLAFIMTTLSRPGIVLYTLFLYCIFFILKSIIKLKLRITIKFLILSSIIFSIFTIFSLTNSESIDQISKLIFSWGTKKEEVSLLNNLLGSIYILCVPFPFGFLNINWLIKGFGDAKFMYFAYSFLSLLGIYRSYLYSRLLKFFIIKKFKLDSSNINIYVLSIIGISIGFSGDEITRQLITIAIPLTIIMEKYRKEYLIKPKYKKISLY